MVQKVSTLLLNRILSVCPICQQYTQVQNKVRPLSYRRYGTCSIMDSVRFLDHPGIKVQSRTTFPKWIQFGYSGDTFHKGKTLPNQVRYIHQTLLSSSQWCMDNPHGNPIDDLKDVVEDLSEILPEKDVIFRPSLAEVKDCQKIFLPKKGRKVEAHRGVVDLKDLPPVSLPEVCFVGRSNVGKSSLVRALFFNTPDVQNISVSKKPGHTRTLKFYSIHKKFSLVDMPGYGFNMPDHYVESVENYLLSRASLQRVFLLIDASVGLNNTDEIGINMLEEIGKPYTIVLTKIDKNSHGRVVKNLATVHQFQAEHLTSCFTQPFLVSALSGAGLSFLRTFIAYVTGNVSIQGI